MLTLQSCSPKEATEHPNEVRCQLSDDKLTRGLVSSLRVSCTEKGWIFEANGKSAGPFMTEEMDKVDFLHGVAARLKVQPKEILEAKLRDYAKEIDISSLNFILASTIKCDETAKAVTFLGMLLAQTCEDQYNIAFQAESSTGKSYIPIEIVQYFPSKDKRIYAGASPTSFFHQIPTGEQISMAVT